MKGQSSIELVLLVGFLTIVMLFFFLVIQTRVNEQQDIKQVTLQSQLADLIEREIVLAARVDPGYMREFDVPRDLDGEHYNLSFEDLNTLVIDGDLSVNEYIRFIDVNVTLTGTGQPYVLAEGEHRIILERHNYGVKIRKDCVQSGLTFLTCNRTTIT